MKNLLVLATLAIGIGTVSAQMPRSKSGSVSPTRRASITKNASGQAPSATTVAPNAPMVPGSNATGSKINTAPATGANRASRSSSTSKAAHQGKATGSGNIESIPKNSAATPGTKK